MKAMGTNAGPVPYHQVGRERKFQLRTLSNTHREILRLAAMGLRPSIIADRVHVTRATVSNTLHSILGQEHMAKLIELRDQSAADARDVIEENQIRAAQEVVDSIDDPKVPYSERYKNCRWLLDAGGNGPRHNLNADGAYTREDVDRIIGGAMADHRARLERRTCQDAEVVSNTSLPNNGGTKAG
jgi:DNA-binding CsgD family transcriptional regulator